MNDVEVGPAPALQRDLHLVDEAATQALAAALAGLATAPLTVFLTGHLGAGKTALVRAFLRARGVCGPVPSPTYTLVEAYEDVRGACVQHFDLYRLSDPEELELIGVRDYFGETAIRFVEWPERGAGLLQAPDLRIELRASGVARAVRLRAYSATGTALLQALNDPRMAEKA